MKSKEYRVSAEQPLLEFLSAVMPTASRSKLKSLLVHNISVDGRRTTRFDFPLKPGMVVAVEHTDFKERFKCRDFDIVYEDNYLLVIDKHAGLLSNSKNPRDVTALSLLNRYLEQTKQRCHAHIVHRLDRDTSGLMIYSKSKEVSQTLERDWKGYVYDRAYVAVVWGQLSPAQGTIHSWLTPGQYCMLSSPVDNGGKEATTHYRTVRTNGRYSLLELKLDTGRRNQIRVHLREEKHPVVHDPMYGYKDDASPIGRLALHAFRLCFVHPITGKKMQFETPYPEAFVRLLKTKKSSSEGE